MSRQDEDRYVGIGCAVLLAAFLVLGLTSSIVNALTQPTDEEMLRACAEACGPGRLASYESLGNDCNCTGGTP